MQLMAQLDQRRYLDQNGVYFGQQIRFARCTQELPEHINEIKQVMLNNSILPQFNVVASSLHMPPP